MAAPDILSDIFGKAWNIKKQIFLSVLGRDNIPKIKYLLIWSNLSQNNSTFEICLPMVYLIIPAEIPIPG